MPIDTAQKVVAANRPTVRAPTDPSLRGSASAVTPDADEDERDDEHPDQPDEQFADKRNRRCRGGPREAQQHADDHRAQYALP